MPRPEFGSDQYLWDKLEDFERRIKALEEQAALSPPPEPPPAEPTDTDG